MFVERRKDNYDELQILAGDVRTRRRRTNMWTTTIIAGTMAATAAYIATTNNQMQELQKAKEAAEVTVNELQPLVIRLQGERDVYKIYADANIDLSKAKYVGDRIGDINVNPGPYPPPPEGKPVFAGVIWLVEGSRRFPMAENDFLWVPDAMMWIKLTDLDDDGSVIVFRDGDGNVQPVDDSTGSPFDLPLHVTGLTARGNANSLCLSLRKPSTRPGFQSSYYADLEVLFENGSEDGSRYLWIRRTVLVNSL